MDNTHHEVEPGRSFDLAGASPTVRNALESAPEDAQPLMAWKVRTLARVASGWSMNTDTMGVYGDYYLLHAIIGGLDLGTNVSEDAIYPMNLADNAGQPLNGPSYYTIHIDKGAIPPAEPFWSITLYDQQGYHVANGLNRFAISSWTPFKYNSDGSLFFQNESPRPAKEANWLLAPCAAMSYRLLELADLCVIRNAFEWKIGLERGTRQ